MCTAFFTATKCITAVDGHRAMVVVPSLVPTKPSISTRSELPLRSLPQNFTIKIKMDVPKLGKNIKILKEQAGQLFSCDSLF